MIQPKSLLESLLDQRELLHIQEQLALEKAFKSNDARQILEAQKYVSKNIKEREAIQSKSLLVDPLDLSSSFGYKEKPISLSFDILRAMAKTDIVKAIIETRKDQVQSFCQPQKDKYSTGFVVEKKSKYTVEKKEIKLNKQQQQRIEDIVEFILNCGNLENKWDADSFDVFMGKIVDDSLSMDQATWENKRNKFGELVQFIATDGSTYRVADSYEDEQMIATKKEELVKGYAPSHVQLYQNNIIAEFYPWELAFCVRNPKTDIRKNGYGCSELEDMVQLVTAILNANTYNSNFFKVGSAPRGILKYSGNINQNTVEDFRKQWIAQVAGVANAHKIPMINVDKLDFIPTHVPNKDMEFSRYQEFLIKCACALYKIDPSEIGMPMSGNVGQAPMFEGNNEARLQYSKDKGLKPLLKKIEGWINKWIISELDPDYVFKFVGIDDEITRKEELEADVQKVQNFQTVNEIRAKYNLDEIEGGDIILNPTFTSMQQMAMMGNQDSNNFMTNEYGDVSNPFTGDGGNQDKNSPFMKALENELPKLLS